jgi:hypothetical protein
MPMKKFAVVALLTFFLLGCSQSGLQSEFWQHDSMYKNWDHLKFSWFGHYSPTAEDSQMSTDQGWWGVDVPYVPAQ